MKITKGPMLERFAQTFEIDLEEVIDWVNAYVNNPELFQNAEKTERERLESIKKYITWRMENSINARIRASIAADKREAA